MTELKDIGILLLEFGGIGTFVFTTMKGINIQLDKTMDKGLKRRYTKRTIAYLLGPITAIVIYKMGYIPLPEGTTVFWGTFGSAFLGFLSTFLASVTHSKTKK